MKPRIEQYGDLATGSVDPLSIGIGEDLGTGLVCGLVAAVGAVGLAAPKWHGRGRQVQHRRHFAAVAEWQIRTSA